jgi:hypothetical protein
MTSRIATERATALSAAKALSAHKAERARAELNTRLAEIHAAHASEVASAEKAAEKMRAACATELITEHHAEMAPLLAAWLDEPYRRLAVQVGEVFQRFDQRAVLELGVPMWDAVLAVAFGVELIKKWPSAIITFGRPDWTTGRLIEALFGFRKSLAMGPGDVESALAALESVLVEQARIATGEPSEECVRTFEILRQSATHADAATAIQAFNEQESARHGRAFAASYAPPEPPSWRARLGAALLG